MVAFLLAMYNQLQNCWSQHCSCHVRYSSPSLPKQCWLVPFGLLLLGLFFLLAENCYLNENCTKCSQYLPPLSNVRILAFEGGFLYGHLKLSVMQLLWISSVKDFCLCLNWQWKLLRFKVSTCTCTFCVEAVLIIECKVISLFPVYSQPAGWNR